MLPTNPTEFNPYVAPQNPLARGEASDADFERIEAATLWRRAVALLLDAIFTLTLFGISIATLFALSESNKRIELFVISHMNIIVLVLPLGTILIYSIAMETSYLQATLGKLALGIKVCDAQGRRVAFIIVIIREVIKYPCCMLHVFTRGAELPFVTYHDSIPSPLLHDILTKTHVLRAKPTKSD